MQSVHFKSSDAAHAADVRRLAWEAQRRAEAMGLVPADMQTGVPALRRLAQQVYDAGVARASSGALVNVELPELPEVADLLRMLIRALEASPVPQHEWRALSGVFEPEHLARLLRISESSLHRYQSGARTTPDEVAARLHVLALVVGDLAGTYNDIGVRRWFERRRTQLEGKSPAALLARNWAPEDAGPQRVRELARSLVDLSMT